MQLVRLSLIFYKGKGTAADKIIRFWTKSHISHSEIETIGGYYCSNDMKTRVMRLKKIFPKNDDWEVCHIALPLDIAKRLYAYQLQKCGTKYDWEGIFFSQLFKFGYSAKRRWFCSKSNLDDIQTAIKIMKNENKGGKYDLLLRIYKPFASYTPQSVSPATLYALAKECEKSLRSHNLLD